MRLGEARQRVPLDDLLQERALRLEDDPLQAVPGLGEGDALAAFLRSDAASAGRCLSRVSAEGLAGRLLPAARALAQAAGLVLAAQGGSVEVDYALSAPCLLGQCADAAAENPCPSVTCQHSCHGRPPALIYTGGAAGLQA